MKYVRAVAALIRNTSNCIKPLQTTSNCCPYACHLTFCRRFYASKNVVDGVGRKAAPTSTFVSLYDSHANDVDVDPASTDIEQDDDDRMDDALAFREVKLDEVARNFPVSCNLAAYVNQSQTLQQFLKLGVDLSRWDEKPGVADFVIGLDFERDVKQRLRFLHDVGVQTDDLGRYLTVNPYILKEDEDDLQVRINYLHSKKFSKPDIARIVSAAPLFLLRTTESIDGRLGYFQKEFHLSGNDVRFIAVRMPKLLTSKFSKIKENQFILKEEFGFEPKELRQLLMTKPKLWQIGRNSLHERFDYVHNTMGISHELILHFPGGLMRRLFVVKQRHLFLVALGRAQYDPKSENYVSLKDVVTGSDADFCRDVAKTSAERFNEFLKTL